MSKNRRNKITIYVEGGENQRLLPQSNEQKPDKSLQSNLPLEVNIADVLHVHRWWGEKIHQIGQPFL